MMSEVAVLKGFRSSSQSSLDNLECAHSRISMRYQVLAPAKSPMAQVSSEEYTSWHLTALATDGV